MNANSMVNATWQQKLDADIAKVEAKWTSWYGKLHAGPFNTDCYMWNWSVTHNCNLTPQPMPPPVSHIETLRFKS